MASVDTLRAFEELKASDLTEAQAKAIVSVVKIAQETGLENLATKEDIRQLEVKIANLKSDLLKWFVGLLVGQAAFFLAILKFFK
jgi:DNA gyrase/topoisomerase IV subunit A